MIRQSSCIVFVIFLFCTATASAQTAGSIRGIVYDKDFNVPLAGAQVTITETGEKTDATDEGNFVFTQVPPGKYTLVFSKEGYIRQVQADVVVSPGALTDVEASLPGEFTDMEEFVVQDLQIGGTEAGLLMLRVESPALLDSISSELISQAGAGDAASALRLVAGATVQDGKYAVIRGLPDRYVNSQMNNVRLPTADPDKRAVQLDQFPSEMIESVQVSKTFTPDQQGDASGGAVNVVLKGIPDETIFKVKTGTSFNSQVTGNRNDFLTYEGGSVNFTGKDDGGRDLPDDFSNVGTTVFGVSRDDAPFNYDMGVTAGGKKDLGYDAKVGAFASAYYKQYSSYYNNKVDNSYWQKDPGGPLIPSTKDRSLGGQGETRLLDITEATDEVQLGVLAAVGGEIENNSLDLIYMRTQVTEDKTTLAEDTRGKEFFYPGYVRTDPNHEGNTTGQDHAPYLRFETLKYTERTTDTLQLSGEHKVPFPEIGVESFFKFMQPEIDWTMAWSTSDLNKPDTRLFNSYWLPVPAGPSAPGLHAPYKPAANFSLGNFQETWQEISEDSQQYFVNNKIPFTQWTDDEGYVKLGLFRDKVERQYDQESFSNFAKNGLPQDAFFSGDFEDLWSPHFGDNGFTIFDGGQDFAIDVDYEGLQEITAWYPMVDLPLNSFVSVIGGVRYEKTELSIINTAEKAARIVLPGQQTSIFLADNPGIADVSFEQEDTLPSMGLVIKPVEKVTVRGAYTRTVARQTFKELSPILQQEYAGGDVFIGNPELRMSALTNYDWRVDYTPYEGGLVSVSWFLKEIVSPIEYIQSTTNEFGFKTAVNYPKGQLSGFEFESRQDMGRLWDKLENLSLGGNLTLIESEVSITEEEISLFKNLQVPVTTRDMLNAPEYLYNIFFTYDLARFGTKIGLFYTVKGDTLVVGAGQEKGEFVPDVYAKDYGTLNLSISKELSKHFNLTFKIKNLTNPEIQEVYRSKYIDGGDVLKTSYTQGIEYSLGVSGEW